MAGVSMRTDQDRLQTAQWVLERNLAWIAAAEVKIGVIVAIDTAMLGGVGAAFSAADAITRTHCAWIVTGMAVLALGAGLLCAALSILPRVHGPIKSLVFFGRIGACIDVEYAQNFKNATDADLLEDWIAQIHRNAQIACEKFGWVRRSMWWSFLAVLPWFAAIVMLLNKK